MPRGTELVSRWVKAEIEVKALFKHTGQQLFSKHIYGTRTFLTEKENCSGGSWWLYLFGKNYILHTILIEA